MPSDFTPLAEGVEGATAGGAEVAEPRSDDHPDCTPHGDRHVLDRPGRGGGGAVGDGGGTDDGRGGERCEHGAGHAQK